MTAIGGKVDVSSKVGVGTKVSITVPLALPTVNGIGIAYHFKLDEALSQVRGLKLGFVDQDLDVEESSTELLSVSARRILALKSSLLLSASGRFGMVTSNITSPISSSVDILMTTESNFQRDSFQTSKRRKLPLIVLSTDLTLDYRSTSDSNGPVIYLSQP